MLYLCSVLKKESYGLFYEYFVVDVWRYHHCCGVSYCKFIDDVHHYWHPFWHADLEMASLALWPFGKEVRSGERSNGCLYVLMNILWIFLGGIWICLSHLGFGLLLCITIIGIPFGIQHFKLAGLALTPFGKDIVAA